MEQNAIARRITIDIAAGDLTAIQAAVKSLQDLLVPYLIDLGPADRKTMTKLGPKTVDFLGKTLSYTLANPGLIKAFVEVDEFQLDVAAVTTLRSLQQPLEQITHMLDSSVLQAGSQAYGTALKCYGSFKNATTEGLPGAVTISSDLAERFANQGKKKKVPVTPGTPQTTATPAIKGSIAPRVESVEFEAIA